MFVDIDIAFSGTNSTTSSFPTNKEIGSLQNVRQKLQCL